MSSRQLQAYKNCPPIRCQSTLANNEFVTTGNKYGGQRYAQIEGKQTYEKHT